jgi:hypothetical protein
MDYTGRYYTVVTTLRNAPLHEHLQHGYEFKDDFRHALRQLINRWQGRVGECIGESNGFLRLRFHDTPGGRPDEASLPRYLLHEVDSPPYAVHRDASPPDRMERELDEAFWFD